MKRNALLTLLLFAFLLGSSQTSSGWKPLFNGKDLSGWKQLNGRARYRVENGEIVGTTVMGEPNSF
uniref:family 16 glycoside hydrolase n=1 Tax=Flavisolibacter nicotianae TaxID=2364882 RepID=UPI000EB26EDF